MKEEIKGQRDEVIVQSHRVHERHSPSWFHIPFHLTSFYLGTEAFDVDKKSRSLKNYLQYILVMKDGDMLRRVYIMTKRICGDFPGGPEAKTPTLPRQWVLVQSLVRELDPTYCN